MQISSMADSLFEENRLGVSRMNENNQYQVYGDLFNEGWNTTCWYGGSGNVMQEVGTVCDPRTNTGPLLRCPHYNGRDICRPDNPNWPTIDSVNTTISKPDYDTDDYRRNTDSNSFRNFMEGFEVLEDVSEAECSGMPLCNHNDGVSIQRHLHNTVSFIVGCAPRACRSGMA